MSNNEPKENIKKKIKILNNPLNRNLNKNSNIKDSNISISKLEGNIPGSTKIKKSKNMLINNKLIGTEDNNVFKGNKNKKKKLIIEELKQKIDDLNTKIITEKQSCLDELYTYNKKISEQEKLINELNNDNFDLLNKLKNIKNEADNHIKLIKLFNVKEHELEKNEKRLKVSINCIEEEIKIEIKNIKTEIKEKGRIKQLLDENNINRENILKNECNSLENVIQQLQSEIKKLEFLSNEHQYCQKYKDALRNTKNILENEYEFEIKKINMFNRDNKEQNFNIKCLNINNINKKNFIKNKSQINIKTKNYINQKFELAHKNYVRNSSEVLNIINQSHSVNKHNNLFLNEEISVLKEIIPEKSINKYNERYINLENEKRLIPYMKKYNI